MLTGRTIKIEDGRFYYFANRSINVFATHRVVQGVYHPDRIHIPLLKKNDRWEPVSFSRARTLLTEKASQAVQSGTDKVRMLTELVGDSQMALFAQSLEQFNSKGPVVFEPLAYERLRAANREVFGIDGLPSYRMERADCLVSLGADFLETWLSPVEYAWRFKAMHAVRPEGKGIFFHISPYQSLTGVNADRWIACDPGKEAVIAMGLIKAALEQGRGFELPKTLTQTLRAASGGYIARATARMAGIDPTDFEALTTRVLKSKAPLILGTGVDTGGGAFQADLAANLLNLVLDPALTLFDFDHHHRMEQAARRADVLDFFASLRTDAAKLLLIHNADPVYTLASDSDIKEILTDYRLFVVSFSNFMDDTTALADLILPVSLPLESWDEYSGKEGMISTVQPAMGRLTQAPQVGDLMLDIAFTKNRPAPDYKSWVMTRLHSKGVVKEKTGWLKALQTGGIFSADTLSNKRPKPLTRIEGLLKPVSDAAAADPARPVFAAVPSIRFFDGRGANRPWLCEIPDPLTKVAWQTPVRGHPETFKTVGAGHGEIVEISTRSGRIKAIAYATHQVKPGMLVMSMGQGHHHFGRYAEKVGVNPLMLMPPEPDNDTGAPVFFATATNFTGTGDTIPLAHTDGSRIQHGRKIALTVPLGQLQKKDPTHKKEQTHQKADQTAGHEASLTMEGFPLTLPLPEGYDPKRDLYPPHDHDHYRWAMVVDLDRCIGCAACAAACVQTCPAGALTFGNLMDVNSQVRMLTQSRRAYQAMGYLNTKPAVI